MGQTGTHLRDDSVSWAIAGFGTGGRIFHAPFIRTTRGLVLTAVVGSARLADDPALAGAALVGSLEDLPALGVEGVTITTPAGTHAELAHLALDLGLHVVVDKPFALTADQARSIMIHAQRAGRMLSVYQNRRWDGDLLTLKAIVDSGEVGHVHRFYSRIQRFRPNLPDWNTKFSVGNGGGTLVDLGPHLIDQAVFLFGRVASVYAELDHVGAGGGAENDVLMSLVHESGTRSLLEASIVAGSHGTRFQLNATDGGVTIDGFDVQETDLIAGRTPASLGSDWGTEPFDRVATIVRPGSTTQRPLIKGQWPEFYAAVAAAARGLGTVPVEPRDAVHTSEVIDAARRAHAEGCIVDIGCSPAPA